MPTITSTPVQVGDGHWIQFKNQQNPFYVEVGSNLYQVLFTGTGISPSATTTNRLGIFKRVAASVGGAWTEQDSSNTPDPGMQSGYGVVSVKGTVISICYLMVYQFDLKIVTYDTATDTWGMAGADYRLAYPLFRFAFVQRSDDIYVVVAGSPFRLYYLTYSAGAWSTQNDLLLEGGNVADGVIDASDRIHIVFNPTQTLPVGIVYYQISATYVISATPFVVTVGLFQTSPGLPSIALWGSDTVVIGFVPYDNPDAFSVNVYMGTPLSAPVFTRSVVYDPTGVGGFSEKVNTVRFATGLDSSLNCFFIDTDNLPGPAMKILQGIWDGSAWSVSIFYDAIANPPVNSITATKQLLLSVDAIELSGGWSVATSAVINDVANPPSGSRSAEFLEANSPAPPPPGPGTITCQIIITGPPPPPHGVGTPKTLRYQIPQRRWFPHTYND